MAKAKQNTKQLLALKERLVKGNLTKSDIGNLSQLIQQRVELQKAIEASKQKVGGKTIISKLPFGLDIVK